MRVSIHVETDTVYKDRIAYQSDCSALLKDNIRALQWYDDHGEIEYINHVKPNEVIDTIAPFEKIIDAAKPFPEPEPLTPQQHLAAHEAFLARHPAYAKMLEQERERMRQELQKSTALHVANQKKKGKK